MAGSLSVAVCDVAPRFVRPELDPRAIVRGLYRGIDGFEIPRVDERRVRKARSSPTYGEIMPTAALRMLESLRLGPRDVFMDLGCGVGKVCMMAALATGVRKVVGVELASRRIEYARRVVAQAEKAGLVARRRVELHEGDILRADFSRATVIYTCSTAFPLSFMHGLMRRLAAMDRPLTFVSTQILDEHPAFEPSDVLRLDMSWRRKSKTYVYRVNHARA